ncbi:MAG TPA: DUF2202 domain-containing protein, partial [Candidatus Hydrogenedentes bacterium]|nr:DUF2202 domain-containing protein [Candidatus Hydrogenedentota bacterium]
YRISTLATCALLLLAGCASRGTGATVADTPPTDNIYTVAQDGTTSLVVGTLEAVLSSTPASSLTKEEAEGLLLMREEEKLAYDVYVVLGAKWGPQPFQSISSAELTHIDAVKMLLDRYQLSDPADASIPGHFKNATLQSLYNDFVAKGERSRVDALTIGATIEDLDIYDLERLARETELQDLQMVYANLARGSRNHLRAFVFNLRNVGADYKPQYISQDAFDKIVSTPIERGRGGGRGHGGRGRGNY